MKQVISSKMPKANPFYSMGYRWEYSCSACGGHGGAVTKAEILMLAKRHECPKDRTDKEALR